MFKLGVITDEISQDLKVAIRMAKKYGLEAVEIRSVEEKGIFEMDNEDIKRIHKEVKAEDLKVCALSSPFFKCHLEDKEVIEQQIKELEKTIEFAKHLETHLIRGFTFWNEGNFDEKFGEIVAAFEKPIKLLEQSKMTLVLESDPSVYATNANKLVRVIERVSSPYVKALWDPGNDIYDPDLERPFPEGYEKIAKHMAHVHLKDAIRKADGKVVATAFGKGEVDFKGQFSALKASGYEGYIVMETHYRPRYELDEQILALPKGSAFSYLGEEATDESLGYLMELLNQL